MQHSIMLASILTLKKKPDFFFYRSPHVDQVLAKVLEASQHQEGVTLWHRNPGLPLCQSWWLFQEAPGSHSQHGLIAVTFLLPSASAGSFLHFLGFENSHSKFIPPLPPNKSESFQASHSAKTQNQEEKKLNQTQIKAVIGGFNKVHTRNQACF